MVPVCHKKGPEQDCVWCCIILGFVSSYSMQFLRALLRIFRKKVMGIVGKHIPFTMCMVSTVF